MSRLLATRVSDAVRRATLFGGSEELASKLTSKPWETSRQMWMKPADECGPLATSSVRSGEGESNPRCSDAVFAENNKYPSNENLFVILREP